MVLVVKNPPATAGDIRDVGLILGLGRSPGEVNGNLLQYSCLENPMDRGVWWAAVHRVAKSWTQLRDLAHTHEALLGQYRDVEPNASARPGRIRTENAIGGLPC